MSVNDEVTLWETLDDPRAIMERTTRLKVPGGWLYRIQSWGDGETALAMCFVPDAPPEHYSR